MAAREKIELGRRRGEGRNCSLLSFQLDSLLRPVDLSFLIFWEIQHLGRASLEEALLLLSFVEEDEKVVETRPRSSEHHTSSFFPLSSAISSHSNERFCARAHDYGFPGWRRRKRGFPSYFSKKKSFKGKRLVFLTDGRRIFLKKQNALLFFNIFLCQTEFFFFSPAASWLIIHQATSAASKINLSYV